MFRSCVVNGLLDENRARQAVTLTLEKKPRGYVGILSQFQRLLKLDIARRTARIESAAPLPAGYEDRLKEDLRKTYGEGLSFVVSQNPALVGGVRIQVGGDVYDGTVQARLDAIQSEQ